MDGIVPFGAGERCTEPCMFAVQERKDPDCLLRDFLERFYCCWGLKVFTAHSSKKVSLGDATETRRTYDPCLAWFMSCDAFNEVIIVSRRHSEAQLQDDSMHLHQCSMNLDLTAKRKRTIDDGKFFLTAAHRG